MIPINYLENLLTEDGFLNIEIDEKRNLTMDNARTLTNVNQVHEGIDQPQA